MKQSQTEATRFREALAQIVSVPKAEIDRREAEWKQRRKARKSNE
jgi:hypothetical protein